MELYHYGIKGQKWGKRRYQNEDGTLTPAGKERYLKGENVSETSRELIKQHGIDKFRQYSNSARSLSRELENDYNNYYKALSKNEEFKKKVWSELNKDFGSGSDDEELFKMDVKETVAKVSIEMRPKSLIHKQQKMLEDLNDYYKEVSSLSKQIIDKYGANTMVSTVYGNRTVSKLAKSFVIDALNDGNLAYIVLKNVDDYSVTDKESFYDLTDLFTMDEYNRRYNK